MTKEIAKVATGVKNIYVIISSIAGILVLATSALFWYKGVVVNDYVKNNPTSEKILIKLDSIGNLVTNLTETVDGYNNNFVTVKTELTTHIRKSKDIKPDEKLDDILRIVNGIQTELKKNDNNTVKDSIKEREFEIGIYKIE